MTTNAERQADYRVRHKETTKVLHLHIEIPAKRALERMALHRGITQKEFLEGLLVDAESRLVDTLPPNERPAYYQDD
jgi:hypothetical protein